MDVAFGLAEGLPSGIYDGDGLEQYLEEVLGDPDRTNDFRLLENELYLTATDLDTCERIVLGGDDWDDVPISRAVAASTALPMIYKPVEIKGRQLIDGGIRSTTNVDVAVENGAKFVIVVNPLVPYVNDFQKVIPTMIGSRVRRVADMGFPQIGYQAFKLLAHQRLHEAVRHWQEKYPGVDIILIEPDPNDELMFDTNIMNFTKRVDIARHGFESVTIQLAKDYDRAAGGLRQARHRDLGDARAQGGPQASPRSASAPPAGAGSSSRRPARCSGSRKRLSPSSRGRARGPRRSRSVAPLFRIEIRTWSSAPSGPPGATITPSAPSFAVSWSPVRPRAASQTKFAWLSATSTGSSRSASSSRSRSRRTEARRRSTRARAILSAWSIAAWVSAFTPSTGAIASSTRAEPGAPTA